ncbi:AraC family transcriptional regulator [Radiobacillus sp. PE A8.2]|uniref:AraC family transcriptional regulator n=1 Tax=Radiobacillus sp. PE A8.2 TaxID=3380349 RepID=UPI00388EE37E
MNEKKRFTFSDSDKLLPLFIDSIGYNPCEQDFKRPEGYPYFHWLQTIKGEGRITFANQEFVLNQNKGMLLTPYTPHSYSNPTPDKKWSTVYITFSGASIDSILDALDINYSAIYETTDSVVSEIIHLMIDKFDKQLEKANLTHEDSIEMYKFLLMLKKYGKIDYKISTLQSYDKVRRIVEWLEKVYPQNIGLMEMSEEAKVSPQHLNTIFHETFGMSPYAFLVQLRIREAKLMLITDRELPLKKVSELVGFNGVSHFVTTFKKREGVTPNTYRKLNC